MKIRLLLSAMVCSIGAFAQISILNSDMPRVNDTLRYSTSSSVINYTNTDSNYVWDYSTMKIDNQDIQKYYAPLQTPYVLNFFSATYGIPENNLSLGPIGGVASDVYSFYKTSNTAMVVVGRGATIQSLPLGIVYGPRDTVFKYPLTYGKSFAGNYYGEAGFSGIGTLKQVGTRSTIVDGWGSITTPYGTFNCIRVKSTVVGVDSVVFNGFGIPVPSNRTEYTWLAKGERYPILEVVVNNTTGMVTSMKMKDRYRPEAYVNNCNFSASKTLIKPGDTVTFTNQSFGNPKTFNWEITPNTYHFASGSSATSEFPKVVFDALGDYSIKLSVTYEGGADDTLKTNLIKVRDAVVAQFSASNTHPSTSETVVFTETSLGSPFAWLWTITPNTNIVWMNGTDLTSKNPQVKFTAVGSYNVQLRATGTGGSNTLLKSNYIQVWPTGLNTLSAEAMVTIFPNPGKDFIQFEFAKTETAQVEIRDLSGRILIQKTLNPSEDKGIRTDELPAGIYLVKICQGEQSMQQKLIIE